MNVTKKSHRDFLKNLDSISKSIDDEDEDYNDEEEDMDYKENIDSKVKEKDQVEEEVEIYSK